MRCVGSRECGFCSWTCGLSCPQGMWDFTELATQIIKNPSAMQETRVQSLYWEDPWRRDWLPTLGILPEEPPEQRSLVGYSLWGGKESDMTKHAHARTHTHTHTHTHRVGVLVPQPGIETVSPALQKGLTTGPPGKSPDRIYKRERRERRENDSADSFACTVLG